jgi:hypothetical protein
MHFLKFLSFTIIIFSVFTVEISWGQGAETIDEEINILGKIGEFLFNDPLKQIMTPFEEGGKGFSFILFTIGLAGFSIFIWYFYRFISRRELIPRFHKKRTENVSKTKFLLYVILNITSFPIVVFVWFSLYSILIFLLSEDLPFELIMFVSMSLIGTIRITSYFKEELARDVGKTIPFSMLGMFLTAGTLFADPNFLSTERITEALIEFQNRIPGIIDAIIVISVIEGGLRGSFFLRRKFISKYLIKKSKKSEE